MTRLVVDKFSLAYNQNLSPPTWQGHPFTPKELKQQILVKSVKDVRNLELAFPLEDQDLLWATKVGFLSLIILYSAYGSLQPGNFLSHFLGHEAEGSILSYLKKAGWANSLSAGGGNGATGFDIFKVAVDLTKEGLGKFLLMKFDSILIVDVTIANYEKVAQTIFSYIQLLRSTPPQEWAFKEISMLSEMSFKFSEKSKPDHYVTRLSEYLHKPYPRQNLLSAPYIMKLFDKDQIIKTLSMLDVEHCRVTVASQSPLPGFTYDKKEQWYGTEYTLAPLPKVLLDVSVLDDQIYL